MPVRCMPAGRQENTLQRTLGFVFNEDPSRVRTDHAAQNMAIFTDEVFDISP